MSFLKKRLVALGVATSVVALAACSGAADTPTPTAPPTTDGSTGGASDVFELPPAEVTKVNMVISDPKPEHFLLKLASDAGLFEKYGIEASVVHIDGTTTVTQAMLAGQMDVATSNASQSLNSLTTDRHLVDIGVLFNSLANYLYVGPDIKEPADLVGKRIAISGIGGQSHASVVASLRVLGVDPNDVTVVDTQGGQAARMAAVAAGTVAAAPADETFEEEFAKEGILPMVKLPEEDFDLAAGNIQVRREWADQNPNTVMRILAACLEAVRLQYDDIDYVIDRYADWARMDRPDAATAYYAFLNSGLPQLDLRSTPEAYAPYIDIMGSLNPGLADVDVSKAFDGQYLDKLEELGFFDELGPEPTETPQP